MNPGANEQSDEAVKMARMREWLQQVSEALGIEHAVVQACIPTLLDLVREVAHGPSRPGAPLTAFTVGLALAKVLDRPDAPAPAAAIDQLTARLDDALTPYRRT